MQPSNELRDLTLQLYEAFSSADIVTLERLISRQEGVLVIGSQPGEWWQGHGTILEVFRALFQVPGEVTVVPGDPQAFSEGSVGWVADQASTIQADGTQVPFRISLIFHKEDGGWKIVQEHVSVGVLDVDLVRDAPAYNPLRGP